MKCSRTGLGALEITFTGDACIDPMLLSIMHGILLKFGVTTELSYKVLTS